MLLSALLLVGSGEKEESGSGPWPYFLPDGREQRELILPTVVVSGLLLVLSTYGGDPRRFGSKGLWRGPGPE